MNTARMQYIHERLSDFKTPTAKGASAVDVGCGGGLAAESLARMGLRTLGVDAALENVQVARMHALEDAALGLLGQLEYRRMTAEQLVAEGRQFDCVVSLEVIEHVADALAFVRSLVQLARPGGLVFVSTMSRTPAAMLIDVVVPEYILGTVPRGTHDHAKFLKPEELGEMLAAVGAETVDVSGLVLEPLSNSCHVVPADWGLLRNIGVQANYILCARKRKL
ncbi:Hexaprenyldihydroxybenzoate methyltransferase, mitochondrial [Kickxella alabastrina]|uniref:Hexaprenyldihydroxybenzoate methyltransferase, mitochondrial n=1 Tax=Kickxella alabastrina TaxID=61397 RepID=A0ACC1HYZ2_9FUNG|nr:Hexaprenyldihydroxybenzoate methyltransferase, mitochondrial [Kickxella alabastrina]